jgi:hypothetical protein
MADTNALVKAAKNRAGERSRTADLPFTRRPLCQLSYTGWVVLMVAETAATAPDGNPGSGLRRYGISPGQIDGSAEITVSDVMNCGS